MASARGNRRVLPVLALQQRGDDEARPHGAALIMNRAYECHNGYLASPAGGIAGSEGEGITVVGGVMKRIQGRPVLCETGRSPTSAV